MAIRCRDIPSTNDSRVHTISIGDIPSLAHLMDVSYSGTIDHEGETLEQCADEMRATIEGKYGPFIREASTLINIDGEVATACLVTMYSGKPLIAFTMTDPKHQRKGLSRLVIERAIAGLARMGERALYLVVTDGNSAAQNLYRKIGFQEIGLVAPKTPLPEFNEATEESSQVIAETPRLLIKTWSLNDVSSLMNLTHEEGLAEFSISGYANFSKDKATDWINFEMARFAKSGLGKFAVFSKALNKPIGISGLFEMPERNGAIELNYRYPVAYRGQGFATEAATAILNYGFEKLRLPVIYANADLRNLRSHSVLDRLGMKRVGDITYEGILAGRWEFPNPNRGPV